MKKYILGFLTLSMTLSSCSDFLSAYSQDQIIPETPTDLDELLLGSVYMKTSDGQTQNGANPSAPLGFLNILDDDVNTTGTAMKGNVGSSKYVHGVKNCYGYFAWQQDVRKNYGATVTTEDDGTWNTFYERINVCNVILDEGERMTSDLGKDRKWSTKDSLTLQRVYGETHFLRAQFFFYLANLYGRAYSPQTADTALCVPLKLTPYVQYDKHKKTQFQRATLKSVYNQMVADLKQAEELLTKSPQNSGRRLHRASWEAADILLSRVYLYMQDWHNAELTAQKVMNSNWLTLSNIDDLNSGNGFLNANNPEIAFSQGSNYMAQNEDNWMMSGMISDYCVTRDLYDLYDPADIRRQAFFSINGLTDSIGLNGKYPHMLKNPISDCMTLRMAEAYLNYAEACAMQPGKEQEANNALNTLRSQRIDNYQPQNYTAEELIEQIRLERRRELCFEGHRWFDLRRYAVNPVYPYSRDIIHVYSDFNDNLAYVGPIVFLLPAGDAAYTFSIPRTVLDFDKEPMPNNPRELRKPIPMLQDTLPTFPTSNIGVNR